MPDHCLIQPTRSPSSDLCGILTQLSLRLARDFAQSNKKKNRAIPPGTHDLISLYKFWSGRRVSNSRPQPWQGCALPTELLPQRRMRILQSLLSLSSVFSQGFNKNPIKIEYPTEITAKVFFSSTSILNTKICSQYLRLDS